MNLDSLLEQLADLVAERVAARLARPQGEDRLLTAKQAADRMGVSVKWLYGKADTLPFARKMGRMVRFSEQGLESWLKKRAAA